MRARNVFGIIALVSVGAGVVAALVAKRRDREENLPTVTRAPASQKLKDGGVTPDQQALLYMVGLEGWPVDAETSFGTEGEAPYIEILVENGIAVLAPDKSGSFRLTSYVTRKGGRTFLSNELPTALRLPGLKYDAFLEVVESLGLDKQEGTTEG